MINSFQDVIRAAPLFADASGPAAVLMSIINRKPAIDSSAGYALDDISGQVEFRNVAFRYPNRSDDLADPYIFRDFSLKVTPGQSVAFVGPSGCGKSTLFSLLLRFYDPNNGAVIIDEDHDLKDVNIRWWLRNVGVVSQEPVIFKTTLRENIMYGLELAERKKLTPEELQRRLDEAVKCANLQQLINDKGWDFSVGERGAGLSGGQKQRVCIARVFLKQPKVILLDEVTSALDPISEAEVITALEGLMKGRTTFVIAHRLHTLSNIDKIFVLKDGKIIDQGTQQELCNREGFFKMMWDKQQKEQGGRTLTPHAVESDDPSGFNLSNSDVRSLMQALKLHEDELKDTFPDIVALMNQALPDPTKIYRIPPSTLATDSMLSAGRRRSALGPEGSRKELRPLSSDPSDAMRLLAPGERSGEDDESYM